MAYAIGQNIFFRGSEITITSAPYALHGGEWQDGAAEGGKTYTVPTPEQAEANVAERRAEWRKMQEGFRRLKTA
jgi:hypothetical protein